MESYIFVICDWLLSLSIMSSRLFCVAARVRISSFLRLNNLPLYVYTPYLCIHLSIGRDCFPPLNCREQRCYEHRYTQISETLLSSLWGCMPRSATAGSYGYSIFNFLRSYHTGSQSSCIILHIPVSSTQGFNFSLSSPTLGTFYSFLFYFLFIF